MEPKRKNLQRYPGNFWSSLKSFFMENIVTQPFLLSFFYEKLVQHKSNLLENWVLSSVTRWLDYFVIHLQHMKNCQTAYEIAILGSNFCQILN